MLGGYSMKIQVPLEAGQLADRYSKYATMANQIDNIPVVSFPLHISEAPQGTKTFALTLLDWDAIPVSGFAWIHWIAANIPGDTVDIPADNSQNPLVSMVQGRNSTAGSLVGNKNPITAFRYNGPQPPNKIHNYRLMVFALDTSLELENGFWLNELQHQMRGHILDTAEFIIPARN